MDPKAAAACQAVFSDRDHVLAAPGRTSDLGTWKVLVVAAKRQDILIGLKLLPVEIDTKNARVPADPQVEVLGVRTGGQRHALAQADHSAGVQAKVIERCRQGHLLPRAVIELRRGPCRNYSRHVRILRTIRRFPRRETAWVGELVRRITCHRRNAVLGMRTLQRVFVQRRATYPGLAGRSAKRRMDDADRDAQRFAQVFRKIVADGGKPERVVRVRRLPLAVGRRLRRERALARDREHAQVGIVRSGRVLRVVFEVPAHQHGHV